MTTNMQTDVLNLVRELRKQRVSALQRDADIQPAEWNRIDELAGAMTREMIRVYTGHLKILMELLIKNDVPVPVSAQLTMIAMNVDAVILGSLLMAHYDVIEERGRTANDAHLHLDRVVRSADLDQALSTLMVGEDEGEPS